VTGTGRPVGWSHPAPHRTAPHRVERRRIVTSSLVIFGILGLASTAVAFAVNRHLFSGGRAGNVTPLEAVYYVVGLCSLGLGWYFNVRYTHLYGHRANYWNYTKMLFTNWAADSAAQDYIIVNVVLLPLWTIVEGTRRGLKWPWIFFVVSLFTSLAFSIALFLAFMERQLRYNRVTASSSTA
jgi:drug/metabolite transporter (DMT)-like permease